MKPKTSGKKYLLLLLLLLLFFVYVTFGPFLKIAIFSLFYKDNPDTLVSIPVAEKPSGKIDSNLVANWDTGCLIPDRHSAWAERHTFSFKSDGTTNHKRYSGSSCDNLAVDHDDQMTWEIVGNGKINLYYSTGGKIYDIYELSNNTLKFGHGFCNCSDMGGAYGVDEGDRFVKLNDFLLYKKQ
ncbi:lipocalin family protein [Candidatus Microgenomates bacterium]|nr:lipocalin family protein [Candidatus Microgenomates bacterium]